ARGEPGRLRVRHTSERRVAQLFDVAFEGLEDQLGLHLRDVVGGVPDVVTVGLQLVVIPGRGRHDDVRVPLGQLRRRAALVYVAGPILVDVARPAGRGAGRVQE